jgi:hypothetical protein
VRALKAIGRDSLALAVGSGCDPSIFGLTASAKLVFAVDLYGTREPEAPATMLSDPSAHAEGVWEHNRLVVEYMNPADLRFEPESFDLVFCLRSLTESEGIDGASSILDEMTRVCRVGGIVAVGDESVARELLGSAGDLRRVGQGFETPLFLRKARRNA